MKKYYMMALLAVFALVLIACNKEDDTISSATTKTFDFSEFSLDVEYPSTKYLEASYDENLNDDDNEGTEAKYEDKINADEKLYGDDALKKLNVILSTLKFDATTSNEDVIREVLKAFNLGDDYKNFELEVTFADGTMKEYNHKRWIWGARGFSLASYLVCI